MDYFNFTNNINKLITKNGSKKDFASAVGVSYDTVRRWGLGADASFERAGRYLIHIFIGKLMSAENNETILKKLETLHELACGEFMDVLVHIGISDDDLNSLKNCAGAILIIDKQTGAAESKLYNNHEEIKSFIATLRRLNAKQLH